MPLLHVQGTCTQPSLEVEHTLNDFKVISSNVSAVHSKIVVTITSFYQIRKWYGITTPFFLSCKTMNTHSKVLFSSSTAVVITASRLLKTRSVIDGDSPDGREDVTGSCQRTNSTPDMTSPRCYQTIHKQKLTVYTRMLYFKSHSVFWRVI